MVKTLNAHYQGSRFNPWLIPQAPQHGKIKTNKQKKSSSARILNLHNRYIKKGTLSPFFPHRENDSPDSNTLKFLSWNPQTSQVQAHLPLLCPPVTAEGASSSHSQLLSYLSPNVSLSSLVSKLQLGPSLIPSVH